MRIEEVHRVSRPWKATLMFSLTSLTLGGCFTPLPSSDIQESTYGTRTSGSSEHKISVGSNEVGSKDSAALERGARAKADNVCPDSYIIRTRTYSDKYFTYDKDKREVPIMHLEMMVQCSVEPRGKVTGAGSSVVEQLAASNQDIVFFDTHAITIAAPYAIALAAARRVLETGGHLMWRIEERKGTIVTAATKFGVVGPQYYDQYFIAFDRVSDHETKMTFKLFSHWRDYEADGPPSMKPHARQVVYGRAARFIDAVKASATSR